MTVFLLCSDHLWKDSGKLHRVARLFFLCLLWLRNTPSTAGNSMTSSERPAPEPILKKEASPAVLGGENSGNAVEASNALNYRVWGIPAVLSREIPGNALRAFPGSFRNFFRKVPAVLGVWPSGTLHD